MAALTELQQWETEVFRIETDTIWIGGEDGAANNQAKQLANRTAYLKAAMAAKQPLDATLTAIAALVTAADKLIYSTAADAFATTPLTAFARTLLDDANAAAVLTTLGAAPLVSPTLVAPILGVATGTSFNLLTGLSATAPVNNGVAAVGVATTAARGDHVHATDTTRAPTASPTFTGTPLAPTASADTNTGQIASTAFVQSVVSGYLSKTGLTGGTITLTDAEANNAVLALTGTLTSNLVLVVPATFPRLWAVYNATTGAFTVTVKTAAGSGPTVAQGKRNLVYTNGSNVYDGFNDFESIAITGTPTAPTAAVGTNTTQLATTAFVQAYDDAAKANLVSPTFTGTPTVPTAAAGTTTTQAASTAFVASALGTIETGIKSITATVASNALTLGLGISTIDFRAPSIGSGTVNSRTLSAALSLVVPSGATLGMNSAVKAKLLILALDYLGTIELAVINVSAGGNNLDESSLITTTAISSAADSAGVAYSTTARTGVPFRVVGYVSATEAVAGTWATAPSLIQGQGGQSVAALGTLGFDQTWKDVSASRAANTTYTNTTGKAIAVAVGLTSSVSAATVVLFVDGVQIPGSSYVWIGAPCSSVFAIVPPGGTYYATGTGGTMTVAAWAELS